MEITITPEADALFAAMEADVGAAIRAGLESLAGQIAARGASEAPRRTGTLGDSITSYLAEAGPSAVVAAAAPYAFYVHDGTGIFGPYAQEIVIRRTSKKGKACEVRRGGQRPNPFFIRAIGAIGPEAVFEQGMQAYLTRRNG